MWRKVFPHLTTISSLPRWEKLLVEQHRKMHLRLTRLRDDVPCVSAKKQRRHLSPHWSWKFSGRNLFSGNSSRLILTQVHIPFGTLLKDPKKWAAANATQGRFLLLAIYVESGGGRGPLKRGPKRHHCSEMTTSFGTRKTHPFGCLAVFFRRPKGVAGWGWWLWVFFGKNERAVSTANDYQIIYFLLACKKSTEDPKIWSGDNWYEFPWRKTLHF